MTFTHPNSHHLKFLLLNTVIIPRYELADGELVDMEPTGPQKLLSGKLATKIGIAITNAQLPWFIPELA
jgi:hypothetical protein